MPTPRRRSFPATGAFFFSALALASLSGCATRQRPSTAPAATTRYAAPINAELGRVFSYDAAAQTAVIELVPHFQPSASLSGSVLIARDLDTLAPRSRLRAAPYLSGRFLGAYVTEGAPAPGDEVVLAPAF
jgi:hypothetical protein